MSEWLVNFLYRHIIKENPILKFRSKKQLFIKIYLHFDQTQNYQNLIFLKTSGLVVPFKKSSI